MQGNDCVGGDITIGTGLQFPLQSVEDVFRLDKMISDDEAKQANMANIFRKTVLRCRCTYSVHMYF